MPRMATVGYHNKKIEALGPKVCPTPDVDRRAKRTTRLSTKRPDCGRPPVASALSGAAFLAARWAAGGLLRPRPPFTFRTRWVLIFALSDGWMRRAHTPPVVVVVSACVTRPSPFGLKRSPAGAHHPCSQKAHPKLGYPLGRQILPSVGPERFACLHNNHGPASPEGPLKVQFELLPPL